MADITITIQAASDSVMTADNIHTSTALGEGDPRRVYGLPNITSHGISNPSSGTTSTILWSESPRWDEVKPFAYQGPQYTEAEELENFKWAYYYSVSSGGTKKNPTTTAFQLRCDSLTHEFIDNVSINPIPAFDLSAGQHDSSGTPGQLNVIVLALGMRTEIIKLSGMLVDRGLVTASNPRRQILLNIARMQHYKTGRGGQGGTTPLKWGGIDSGILNPRSYTCLNIFESRGNRSIGYEPSGDSRQYRGIIKDLSFRLEGGRPDHWFWNMTFAVIANEHSPLQLGSGPFTTRIDRIRLVDDNDGSASEVPAGSGYNGWIEIRSTRKLSVEDSRALSFDMAKDYRGKQLSNSSVVYLSGTNSVPSLNGWWHVCGVNVNDKTFVIEKASGNEYDEQTTIMDNTSNTSTTPAEELKWNVSNFVAGNEGYISWGEDRSKTYLKNNPGF